jgi:hypothetical protein
MSKLNEITKFFTKERILILIIFIVLIWALYSYSGMKLNIRDGMGDGSLVSSSSSSPSPSTITSQPNTPPLPSGYLSKNVVNPSDLLPKDSNSQWSSLNPITSNANTTGGTIMAPDLLTAGYHIGIDTIGQTLRNANYQLRSDPVIPKQDVGPWSQSTIEPDMLQVPLEIGGGVR